MSGSYKTILDSLHRLLVCAGERQELRNVLPELAINYIMSIFMGMAHQTMLYKRNPQLAENFSVEKWEEEIVGLLLHGLSVE